VTDSFQTTMVVRWRTGAVSKANLETRACQKRMKKTRTLKSFLAMNFKTRTERSNRNTQTMNHRHNRNDFNHRLL
jgi:hypothetical protein